MISRYSLAAILALLALGLAACGGGDEEVAEPGTVEPGIAEQPTAAAPPAPVATPKISGNLLESEEKGYSVRFPEGWTPVPNYLPVPGSSVDAFFAPEEVRGIQPNIAITCETLKAGVPLREYFDGKMDIVRQVAQVEPEVSSREVGGQEALVSHFAREDSGPSLERTEVVFVTETCGWSIALTMPLGEETSYEGVFDEFLDSFRLLP